ncbi:MAG: hypothetical protein LBI62_09015 [Candidatus Accumulibacter sp.]|nr:hypothetical protein [Accumulibacter sp.]
MNLAIRDQGSGIRDQGSGIRDQGSGIRDQMVGFSAKMYLKLRVQGNHSPAGGV